MGRKLFVKFQEVQEGDLRKGRRGKGERGKGNTEGTFGKEGHQVRGKKIRPPIGKIKSGDIRKVQGGGQLTGKKMKAQSIEETESVSRRIEGSENAPKEGDLFWGQEMD